MKRYHIKRFNLLLVFLLIALIGHAQNQNWVVYNMQNADIPDNYIRAMAIDNQGNKWIGTWMGLVKFDGNWTVYDSSNSGLHHNNVTSIAIDDQGTQWIGTAEAGLAKYDGSNWTAYDPANISSLQIQGMYVKSIAIDDQGTQWIGTNQQGMVKFDGTNWTIYNESNSGLPDNRIGAIAIDDQGNKWIGMQGRMAKFDGTNWTVYDTQFHWTEHFRSITIDGVGNIWAGTISDMYKFDGTTWTTISARWINSIAIDDQWNKWVGTYYSGMLKIDFPYKTIFDTTNSPLPCNYVSCIAIDKRGNKWIGTTDGIAVFNENGVSVEVKEQSRNDLKIYPNPTSDNVRLSMKSAIENIQVYDLAGQQIMHIDRIQAKKTSVNLADIEPGVYLFRIRAGDQVFTRKIVKQ